MNEHQARFQALLRELFQFDSADLDFGIYRIMNHKRDVIERYIAEDLPKRIEDELSQGALLEQRVITRQLGEAQKEIREVLGRNALDSDGNLQQAFHETLPGERYLRLKRRQEWHVAHGPDIGAAQATLYQHLYGFFSRYYDNGDIVSKRRYSRRERYAIPYNGEEVHLHWANKDQYYVKTGEHFRNYAFKAGDVTVRFAIVDANVEQGNLKGEKRYFFPRLAEVEWQDEVRELHIPFEFRPATSADKAKNGQNHLQEELIAQAVADLPNLLDDAPLAAVAAERHRNGDKPVTLFEYHMRRYTRRNTTDFFIHKDLKGFLGQEFDFYLKNEVLNIDGVETTDPITAEGWARGWFQILQLMKIAAGQIIDFLAQAETFQKTIWEKRKFVTDVQYCITVGCIDKRFHESIASCEPQWREWIDYAFFSSANSKTKRLEFLVSHPTLVLDTRHFDRDFVDALLASFADIDDVSDGLLVHSENNQALNLMASQLSEMVSCFYIDPPYNTGHDEDFIYKDSYRHSSWMSMMSSCLAASRYLASSRAGIFVSTDDGEYANLKFVLDETWGTQNFVSDIIWNSRKSVSSDTLISIATNHTTFYAADREVLDSHKSDFRLRQSAANFSNPDADPRGPWTLDPMDAPNVRENLTYVIVNPKTGREFSPPPGRCWRFEQWRSEELISEGRIVFGRNGNARPQYKRYLSEALKAGATPSTLWDDVKTTTDATRMMLNMFGSSLPRNLIDKIKPKPVELVERCALLLALDGDTVLDFFSGSGTTGHAVLRLNREDGLRRRFAMIEMGDYFDTVMLPRLKKAIFAPDWRDGKPAKAASEEDATRGPRIIKYVRLESYEDALNNIEFAETGLQRMMEIEDYLIKYMMEWETRESATLLNVEQLSRPFDYRLATYANGNGGSERADVAETFNYLLGLRVQTRKVYHDDERNYLVYRGTADGQETVVIWRDTEDWKPADFRRDEQFLIAKKIAEDVDIVYANGICFLDGAQALEPLFKERMFAPLS